MPDNSIKEMVKESTTTIEEESDETKISGSSNNNIELTGTLKFVLPSSDGSPPKILSLSEVTELSKNVENMTLIHEIALNQDFKLQQCEPANNMEKMVKDMVHKAFWNILREELNRDPPCYDQALKLLNEVKESFRFIISERNTKLLGIVNETLDSTLIHQQAKNNTLDFKAYADFVINLLAKSCAPVRDEQIKNLSELTDVVDVFKGILDVITLMKLDMANCILDFTKKELIKNAIEYEKKKFEETLKYTDNFPATVSWLKRNEFMYENSDKINSNETIFRAYVELLDWDAKNNYPDIFLVDKQRLNTLSITSKKLCFCSTIYAVLSNLPIFKKENFKAFADQIYILLDGVTSETEILNLQENIWVHIQTSFPQCFAEQENGINNVDHNMKEKLFDATNKNSLVYKLMWKRLITYICLMLKTKSSPPPPPGYEMYEVELDAFASNFKRIIMYNYSVYGEYYLKIINDKQKNENST